MSTCDKCHITTKIGRGGQHIRFVTAYSTTDQAWRKLCWSCAVSELGEKRWLFSFYNRRTLGENLPKGQRA